MLTMQKDAATSVLNLSVKADESRFRVQNEMAVGAILAEIRRLKATAPRAIENQAATGWISTSFEKSIPSCDVSNSIQDVCP